MADTLVTMYDAVAWQTIPGTPQVLLGYVDVYDPYGVSIYERMREAWPNATIIPITTTGVHSQQGFQVRACDMETNDLTPAQAAAWAKEELSLVPSWSPPTIYCQAANGQAVEWALADVGLDMGKQVPWYMAWWNDEPDLVIPAPPWPILPAPIAHQYISYYDQYDVSVALSSWVWPQPPLQKEEDVFATDGNGNYYRLTQYAPLAGQAANTTTEQWRLLPTAEAQEAQSAGYHIFGAGMLALWGIHKPT